MRFLIDITPKHTQGIQKQIEKGNYSSISQFVSTAIENQLMLEENEVDELIPIKPVEEKFRSQSTKEIPPDENSEKYSLVNILSFNNSINPPAFDDLVFASQGIKENDIWLWGQINKIFPVKLGLRILHQLLSIKQSVGLDEFLELAAENAALIGDNIRAYELKNSKMRGEKISAALPGWDDKSQSRYKFQFMVYPRKNGQLDGAMALMKFCNIYTEKKKQMIGITGQGLKFSSLNNPVLDLNDFDRSLSEEESIFYINHIKENVKGEYAAMQWMIEKIKSGKKERESLNQEIEKDFLKKWGEKTTEAVISTQRAGLIARMFELGLIEKEKDGIYVKYEASKIGERIFLK